MHVPSLRRHVDYNLPKYSDHADALAVVRESWETETTDRNLRLILEAREKRHETVAWAMELENDLGLYGKT